MNEHRHVELAGEFIQIVKLRRVERQAANLGGNRNAAQAQVGDRPAQFGERGFTLQHRRLGQADEVARIFFLIAAKSSLMKRHSSSGADQPSRQDKHGNIHARLIHVFELQLQVVKPLMHGRRRQSAFLQHSSTCLGIESALFGQLHRNIVMLKIDDHVCFLSFAQMISPLRDRARFATTMATSPIGTKQANANCCAPANTA